MPHSRKHALKLLRHMPVDTAELLYHRRYWDETFFGVFLEHCDEVLFQNPQAGLRLAEVGAKLAPKCAQGEKLQELLVGAYAVLGSAYRSTSRYKDAEAAYEKASRIAETATVSKCDKADLEQRIAYLLSRLGQHEEALKLATGAVSVLRSADDKRLDDALVKLGVVQLRLGNHTEAIKQLSEVLTLVTPQDKPRSAEAKRQHRVYHTAVHNLAFAYLKSKSPAALKIALRFIWEAKRCLRGASLAKYKLNWLEGLIFMKIGLTRQAERLFKKARLGFLELSAPFEIALVGLDLSSLYHLEDRWSDLESLASETFKRFRELAADTESIAALSLWNDAVQSQRLRDQLISDVKAKLNERIRFLYRFS